MTNTRQKIRKRGEEEEEEKLKYRQNADDAAEVDCEAGNTRRPRLPPPSSIDDNHSRGYRHGRPKKSMRQRFTVSCGVKFF